MSRSDSTFRLKIKIPRRIQIDQQELDREAFYSWLWARFADSELLGIHQGTLLTEQAAQQGLETESWLPTIDAGLAPRDRDWVGLQEEEDAELFFGNLKEAQKAASVLKAIKSLKVEPVEEQKTEDWNAVWKASFQGADVPPFWRILPPWKEDQARPGEVILKINPGAGFGTGTHETTQLCLQTLGEVSQSRSLSGARVLDFGSGSGILSIGAALLGAQVDAIEIDPLANDNAMENAKLNGVESRVSISESLESAQGTYTLVMANILRPILLEFADELIRRLSPQGTMILSGLVEGDLREVTARFSKELPRRASPRVLSKNEWRALVWL